VFAGADEVAETGVDQFAHLWLSGGGEAVSGEEAIDGVGEFEQVEHEESKQRGGTGLGLSICRWLIQMHGGRMWVESTTGKGSVFYFALPLVDMASLPQPEALIVQAV